LKPLQLKSKPGDPAAASQILVVDDEEDLLELVRYNLAKEGYRVQGVTSGEEALKAVRRQPPDLIVLDWMLPAVDGLEICRRLKSDPKTRDIPVVMLTAKGEESDMVKGSNAAPTTTSPSRSARACWPPGSRRSCGARTPGRRTSRRPRSTSTSSRSIRAGTK
jgi:CheY-like chemotaxis protein